MQTENDRKRLLMNSDKAKSTQNWLLADFINDYPIDCLGITIALWTTFPFITVMKGHHKIYRLERK